MANVTGYSEELQERIRHNTDLPIRRHATVQDFQRWEDLAAIMTDAELLASAMDCRTVEALWRGHDAMVEGFYSDQAGTYSLALRRRRAAGTGAALVASAMEYCTVKPL